MMELLQGFDQQKIYREPDRSTPVGIAAEEPRGRFAWLVIDAILVAVSAQNVGMLTMDARDGANSIRRKKLVFIEHHFQDSPQLAAVHDRQQAPLSLSWSVHARNIVREVMAIFDKPFQPPFEALQPVADPRLEGLHGKQRNQTDHGPYL